MKLGLSHGENEVMRKILEPKRNEVQGVEEIVYLLAS
jgi:hypothetical protein